MFCPKTPSLAPRRPHLLEQSGAPARPLQKTLRSLVTWVALLQTVGCSDDGSQELFRTARQEIIYGEDDRLEAFSSDLTSTQRSGLQSTAAVIPWDRIQIDSFGHVTLDAPTLEERLNVCEDERFSGQLSAADCSAVLVQPDLVMTAGHCVAAATCSQLALVFGFKHESAEVLRDLSGDDVYSCAEVEQHSFGSSGDYAVVRLDRPVHGVMPARLRIGRLPLPVDAPLFIAGHPSGLPLKVAAGAQVSDPRAGERDYFTANLDSFPGNSGGGVFSDQTGELVGILVRGPNPGYVLDQSAGCQRPEQASPDAPARIESIYAHRPRDAHCIDFPDSSLCSCGDGVCNQDQSENSATCYEDCGSVCGDGECNGSESGNGCYVDCGRCGNQICEQDEVVRRSCAVDCGCRPGLKQADEFCLPHLGNVNGDETIDHADILRLRAALHSPRIEVHARAGDVDCSGTLDSSDLDALSRFVRTGKPVPCLEVATAALGSRHSCVLTAAGQVRCWGHGQGGLLGSGPPATPPSNGSSSWDGTVRWAHRSLIVGHSRDDALIDLPKISLPTVSHISAGPSHSCALTEDGAVYCWGDGSLGQLGYGDRESIGDDEAAFSRGPVPLSTTAIGVAAGGTHTCAVLSDGSLSCWGSNSFGQLGYGIPGDVGAGETPRERAPLVFGSRVEKVALGFDHTCALLDSGAVHCWGANLFGQLGRGSITAGGPLEQASETPALDIAELVTDLDAFQLSTCVTSAGGRAYCFGENLSGQLGYAHRDSVGDDELPRDAGPIALDGEIRSLRLGATHACALLRDRRVKCWGGNLNGELGLDHALPLPPGTSPRDLPPVDLGTPAEKLYVGAHHSCISTADGSLRCWGGNESGQLGLGVLDEPQVTPASLEEVSLQAPDSTVWHFEDQNGVTLRARERRPSSQGVQLQFFVRNDGPTTLSDFEVYYSIHPGEAPGAELVFEDRSTPWSVPYWKRDSNGSPIRSIRFDFAGLFLAPGESTRRAAERLEVRFASLDANYRYENDPGAVQRTLPRLFGEARGYTLVGPAGDILWGWSRSPSGQSQ